MERVSPVLSFSSGFQRSRATVPQPTGYFSEERNLCLPFYSTVQRHRHTAHGTGGYREGESTSNIRASTPQFLPRRYKVFLRSSELDINAIA